MGSVEWFVPPGQFRLIAAHAACCTACHGVGATPNPAGANIGLLMNLARHSPSPM